MATGTTTTNGSISVISGFCVYGEARYGSNGDVAGDPEIAVGHDASDAETTRIVWDSDLTDGLDSNSHAVTFSAEVGGGANGVSLSVAGADSVPIVYVGKSYGTISKVRLRAGVQINGSAAWSSVQVRFYRSGRLIEQYPSSGSWAGPAVDTTNAGSPVSEQILEVTPQYSTNTKVTVTGVIRLTAPSGNVPSTDDLFTQIFINTSTCT